MNKAILQCTVAAILLGPLTATASTPKKIETYNPKAQVLNQVQAQVDLKVYNHVTFEAYKVEQARKAEELRLAAQKAAEAKKAEEAAKAQAAVKKPVTAPKVAQTAPSGCVTGYSTGRYALDQIIAKESGGRSCATNAGGCFGLLQACPGAPLKAACGGNPSCQIAWFTQHKLPRYGTWEAVWSAWQVKHWW